MSLVVDGKTLPYKRIVLQIEKIDPLSWLTRQNIYPKLYWQDRSGKRKIAAVGKSLECFNIPKIEGNPETLFFGGCHFDQQEAFLWKGFPSCYFFLPKYELQDDKLIIHQIGNAPYDLNELFMSPQALPFSNCRILKRRDLPTFKEWEKSINRALDAIEKKQFQKVILARKSTFHLESPISPFTLLNSLKTNSTTLFGFEFKKNRAFFGASPEMLYRKENGHLFTEALASSSKNVNSLKNEKEQKEFSYVSTFMLSLLDSLCQSVEKGPIKVLNTGYLHHKYLEAQGKLERKISDRELIEMLHPTPAIGGFPKKEALSFITKEEPFKRGWYAAPVGFIGSTHAEFAVAIRSCLMKGLKLHLFAGAGIVEGSYAQKEWQELEDKIAPFTKVFYD